MANPSSIVITYQGDGDLAAIGLAEIIHAAQLGVPITVIFVNNAIYGMTGGQMAPTTLLAQTTTTSPAGRRALDGQPLKVAELIAGLDGPVYVERVALFDIRTRKRAKRAIEKALQLQVEGRGFALVEVLSECPTHLKMTGPEAEAWVRDCMVPIFPLGVLKDETREPWTPNIDPTFDPKELATTLGLSEATEARSGTFPSHIDPDDVALKLAGAGGDGAQTAALLLAKSAIALGLDATHIPSYGPESRGGTSYADVHIARTEVLSPACPTPNVLIAFNAPSLDKFAPDVAPGGIVLYDSTVVSTEPSVAMGVRAFGVPFTKIARELGAPVVKNVVALGALCAATRVVPSEVVFETLRRSLTSHCAMIPINEEAFRRGAEAYEELSRETARG
jgi:2-oxoisovalerate ferredoxin oxidoreductase beta subunit